MADRRGNNGGGGVEAPAAPGPEAWFHSLPILTKCWFSVTAIITVSAGGVFDFISPDKLYFDWRLIRHELELWRFVTPFTYAGWYHGKLDFSALICLYNLVNFSRSLERNMYNTGGGGRGADYAFLLLLGMFTMIVTYPLLSMWGLTASKTVPPYFTRNIVHFILYVWSRRNPNVRADINLFPVKGAYLPFAHLAIALFSGHPVFDLLHGIILGHVYYYLVDVVPLLYGKRIIQTPQFLIDYFNTLEGRNEVNYNPLLPEQPQQQPQPPPPPPPQPLHPPASAPPRPNADGANFGARNIAPIAETANNAREFHAPGRVSAPRDPTESDSDDDH